MLVVYSLYAGDRSKSSNAEYIEATIQSLIDVLKQPNVDDSVISDTCSQIYHKLDSGMLDLLDYLECARISASL